MDILEDLRTTTFSNNEAFFKKAACEIEQLRSENADLKSTLHHAAQMEALDKVTIEQQSTVIEQMQKSIQIAAEQIRKCDYTPARSTLLCVMKDFK